MRKTDRVLTGVIAVLVAVPLAGAYALMSTDERYAKQTSLQRAIEQAAEASQVGESLQSIRENSTVQLERTEAELQQLAREKRAVRLMLADALENLQRLKDRGLEPETDAEVVAMLQEQWHDLRAFSRYLSQRNTTKDQTALQQIVARLLTDSLGQRVERDMRQAVVLEARAQLLSMVQQAEGLPSQVAGLRETHQVLLDEYQAVQRRHDAAGQRLHASASRQAEVKRIHAEVQSQILQMQAELARIDARLRRRAERSLIDLGLIDAKENAYTSGAIAAEDAGLIWPVNGRLTAGFHDHDYRDFFGVDHQGIDIAVPQGTPVHSAAEGVVYLARPGGKTGYSYVLIGHRGGIATLYGHLSRIDVENGQQLAKGESIGLSGGRPGTDGAGPMTTGAHLHFEVIENGEHINPLTVLD